MPTPSFRAPNVVGNAPSTRTWSCSPSVARDGLVVFRVVAARVVRGRRAVRHTAARLTCSAPGLAPRPRRITPGHDAPTRKRSADQERRHRRQRSRRARPPDARSRSRGGGVDDQRRGRRRAPGSRRHASSSGRRRPSRRSVARALRHRAVDAASSRERHVRALERTLGGGSFTCRSATATKLSPSNGASRSAARRARRRASRRPCARRRRSPLACSGRDVVARAQDRARLRDQPVLDVERARDPEVGHLRTSPFRAARSAASRRGARARARARTRARRAISMRELERRRTGSRPSRSTSSFRFSPSTYSKTMNWRPSSSPRSITVTMFGCASCRPRAPRAGSARRSPRRRSSARGGS